MQLFPKDDARSSKTLHLTGVCRPARMVSGDYYDYFCLQDRKVALAIGDVAGKGISAALLMAAIQSVMRAQFTHVDTRRPVYRYVARCFSSESATLCEYVRRWKYATLLVWHLRRTFTGAELYQRRTSASDSDQQRGGNLPGSNRNCGGRLPDP